MLLGWCFFCPLLDLKHDFYFLRGMFISNNLFLFCFSFLLFLQFFWFLFMYLCSKPLISLNSDDALYSLLVCSSLLSLIWFFLLFIIFLNQTFCSRSPWLFPLLEGSWGSSSNENFAMLVEHPISLPRCQGRQKQAGTWVGWISFKIILDICNCCSGACWFASVKWHV